LAAADPIRAVNDTVKREGVRDLAAFVAVRPFSGLGFTLTNDNEAAPRHPRPANPWRKPMPMSLKPFALTLAVCALAASSTAAFAADESIGAEYGAREPAMCEDASQPEQGPPSEEQLLDYLKCTMEGIGDGRLYLIENLTAQVTGEGRAFDAQRDYYDDIDRAAMIYPISGSLLRYNCDVVIETNAGASCETYEEDAATGVCYKMTSGDWNCRMSDLSQVRMEGVAPPQ